MTEREMIKIAECVFDLTTIACNSLHVFSAEGDVDSREIFHTIYELAKEYERTHEDDGNYLSDIEEFGTERLKGYGLLGSDAHTIEMDPADETAMMFVSGERAFKDRRKFVQNLGVFLTQTRDGVLGADLDENDIVTITYKRGGTHKVNVHMDSYAAIIRDVTKNI